VRIAGDDCVFDNTWLWHADHDNWGAQRHLGFKEQPRAPSVPNSPLPYKTDSCISGHALAVDGAGLVVYGLMAEHTQDDVVSWRGERGQSFLVQIEVPYYVQKPPHAWGAENVAYRVSALEHTAIGLGGYVVNPSWVGAYTPFTQRNMFAFDAHNTLERVFAWINPPGANSYINVFNTSSGFALPLARCDALGGLRLGTACYWDSVLPPAPPVGPMPPPSPPHPPAPPCPPPAPPKPPPPARTYCVIHNANGGNVGAKLGQSDQPLVLEACVEFCEGIAGADWFLLYNIPGYCFCYDGKGRDFPGPCYSQPGGAVGTLTSGCAPVNATSCPRDSAWGVAQR